MFIYLYIIYNYIYLFLKYIGQLFATIKTLLGVFHLEQISCSFYTKQTSYNSGAFRQYFTLLSYIFSNVFHLCFCLLEYLWLLVGGNIISILKHFALSCISGFFPNC